MHPFDILSLSLVLIFAVMGLVRGFVSELFRLAAIVVGFIGALISYETVYRHIIFIDIGSRTKTILSFILAFIVICFAVLIIGWVIRKIIHLAMLGWADRLLGALAGGFKAVVLIWLAVLSFAHLPDTDLKQVLVNSRSYKLLNGIPLRLRMPALSSFNKKPELDFDKSITDSFNDTRERLEKLRHRVDSLKKKTDPRGSYSTNDL